MLNDILTHLHVALLIIIQQTWHLPKFLVIIFQILSSFMSSWLMIVTHHLSYRLEGLLLLESSFTSSCPSLNLLGYSKINVYVIVLFLYACWSISGACDGVFINGTKNFKFIHCLVFICTLVLIAEWPEKRAVNKSTLKKNALVSES